MLIINLTSITSIVYSFGIVSLATNLLYFEYELIGTSGYWLHTNFFPDTHEL